MTIEGHQIVEFRKSLGLSQKELADAINYSRTYLSDIEVGKSLPSRRFLDAISKRFGISLDALAGCDGLEDWINYIISTTENDYFIFIYGFTDEELKQGEKSLMNYMSRMNHVVVDAGDAVTYNDLLAQIMGKKVKDITQEQYERFCLDSEHFFILIKNLSHSKIPEKGLALRRLIKTSENQTVIIIDKPSLLEKYQEELYPLAKLTTAC